MAKDTSLPPVSAVRRVAVDLRRTAPVPPPHYRQVPAHRAPEGRVWLGSAVKQRCRLCNPRAGDHPRRVRAAWVMAACRSAARMC
jgi:hypothetical protein